jgi:hypothetical protein
MQRESVSTPRQRAPQGATNRAQLKAPPLSSPAPAATPRTLAPPKTLLAAAAEASASRPPPTSHAQTAASTPAASRPQSTLSRSSSQSSRGGLRPCVRSIAHALKVSKHCSLYAPCVTHHAPPPPPQVFGSDAVDAGDVAAALRDVGVVVDGRCARWCSGLCLQALGVAFVIH